MENSFSVFEVLQTAWDITRKNLLVLMGYSAVAFVSLFVLQFLSVYIMSSGNSILNFLGLAVILLANSMATLGFYKLTFKLIDDEAEDFDFQSIVPSWKNISSFITITLLIGFIVTTFSLIFKQLLNINLFSTYYNTLKSTPWLVEALGLLAFVVFVLLVVRFMFFPCFIVDDNSSSFESLRQSRELTYHNLTRIITVLLLVIGFIVVGFLALGVGIIVTYPFTNVILVVTYRKLVYSYGVEHPGEQLMH
jgi:uncharacterized membrane protein